MGNDSVGPLRDVDGDGWPEFVVTTDRGGNGGSGKTFVLKDDGGRVVDLNPHLAGEGEMRSELRDVDGDGRFELVTVDPSMQSWPTSHGGGWPYPAIVLAIRDGRFTPAPDLMRRSATPTGAELCHARDACRRFQDVATDEVKRNWRLSGTMLVLIYAGLSAEAYAFLDDAWPGDAASKAAFVAEFRAQLKTSPYRDALVALGHPPFD